MENKNVETVETIVGAMVLAGGALVIAGLAVGAYKVVDMIKIRKAKKELVEIIEENVTEMVSE